MLELIIFMIFIISAIAVLIGITMGNKRWKAAEAVDCPICGNNFKLIGGNFKCTKCRKRIVKTSDGQIKAS
ncbi:hypothetical protein ACFQZR_21160 [Paenibacillus sp. GCM10027629]|uniref:hypothetical protein n=1 Tax=Paenibacillus sp. GCM10027629 TaxID=3273414 RepID=UPI00362FFFF8